MLIAIDASHIYRDRAGIGRLIAGVVEGLKAHPQHKYLVVSREDLKLELPSNFKVLVIPAVSKWLGGGVVWYFKLGRELRRRQVGGLISATLSLAPVFFDHNIEVINDLAPLEHPEHYSPMFVWRYKFFLRLCAFRSWKLAAISQTTADKLQSYYPQLKKHVQVIPLGLDEWVSRSSADTAPELGFNIPSKYFFSLSTIQPRKNYVRMLEAFAIFQKSHPDYHYLISGNKGWHYNAVFKRVQELGLQNRVHFLGFADDKDMPYLFDHASALLFCSINEGFGIPIIQALARGVPVVASDIPVLRELAHQNRVVYVNPISTVGIAQGMEQAAGLDKLDGDQEIMRKYSWQNCAAQLLSTFSK